MAVSDGPPGGVVVFELKYCGLLFVCSLEIIYKNEGGRCGVLWREYLYGHVPYHST